MKIYFSIFWIIIALHQSATGQVASPVQSVGSVMPLPPLDSEVPFVAGHSEVPIAAPRTRFESASECEYRSGRCCNHAHCKPSWKSRMQYKYWGYANYFCERPYGSFTRSHLGAQIDKGAAAQMVFYRYDFFDDNHPQADTLKPAGEMQLELIAKLMLVSAAPIMVESTGDATRDAVRRNVVDEALARVAGQVLTDRVITIQRDRFGISGDEAVMAHERMLRSRSSSGSGQSARPGVPPLFSAGGDR